MDPLLQGYLVLNALAWFLITALVLAVALFLPVVRSLHRDDAEVGVAEVMLHLHGNLWWALALCAVIVVVASVSFSHRIAGPLVRVKRHLWMLARGEIPPAMQRRRHDFMHEEVAALNAAARCLDEQRQRLRAHACRIRHAIDGCAVASDADASRTMASAVEEALRCLEQDLESPRAP